MTRTASVDEGPARGLRLFLSSTRLDGALSERLRQFLHGRVRAAVVANAIDGMPEADRRMRVQTELELLSSLGLRSTELDLRGYVDGENALAADLSEIDFLWVRGGNVFVLRSAMALSGCDHLLRELLPSGSVAYGGYSAGSCVVGTTLEGLELADDPAVVDQVYGGGPEWHGIGLLDFAVVPHCNSPAHPKSSVLDMVADLHRRHGRPHMALRDGQAIVVRGADISVV